MIPHPLNWSLGWALLLASFLAGALIGLRFHDDGFLGGYSSFPRRILRLGHISLAALGMLNVLFALCPFPPPGHWSATAASGAFALGGVAMPAICFLAAWRQPARHLFFIPVSALILAVLLTLLGGGP